MKDSELQRLWRRVPPKFRRFVAERPIPAKHQAIVDAWQPGASLLLGGPTGSLKTTLCAHLVRRLLVEAKTDTAMLRYVRRFCWARADAIIAAGGDDSHEAQSLLHRAKTASLLVLDDVACSSRTLDRVFEYRYDEDREIVTTTGALDDAAVVEAFQGEATVRWVLQAGERPGKMRFLERSRTARVDSK